MALNIIRRVVQWPPEGSSSVTAGSSYGDGSIAYAGSATVMMLYAPFKPFRLVRWGSIVTTTASDNSTGTLKFTCDLYPTVGSASSATTGSSSNVGNGTGYNSSNSPQFFIDTIGGSITVPNSLLNAGGGLVAGSVVWHTVASQVQGTSGYYPDPDTVLDSPGGVDTQLVVYPGQQLAITCRSVGSTAGAGKFFMEIEEQPFVADYNNNAQVVSGYPSSNGTTPTPSWPFAHSVYNYTS